MSGCGRKHRAKHLVRQYLDDDAWDGPSSADEILAVCISAPSAKHVHVVLVDPLGTKGESKVEEPASEAEAPTSSPAPIEEAPAAALPPRAVADLPGKFKKVLWLGCGDLVVIKMGAIQYKPSPPQLKSFYASPEGKEWEGPIKRAEAAARTYFKEVQSQNISNSAAQNLSGGGKFSVRNADANSNTNHGIITGTAASTSAAAPSNAKHAKVTEVDPLAGMMGDSEDDLNNFVNPNRLTIKHQRQAFFPDEVEEEEEWEEGEEAEEEEEKVDE